MATQAMREISCIIPHYNEGQRLNTVLDEIINAKGIDEIICVDDSSDDDRTVELQRCYPTVRFLRLGENRGKSGAVKEGLRHARGDVILLLDADLRNLCHEEIDKAIVAIQHADDMNMLTLRRVKASFPVKLNRGDVLLTGERMVKTEDLSEVLNHATENWQLENAINWYMYRHKKKVAWLPHSGLNTYRKRSLWDDIRHFFIVQHDIISAVGLVHLAQLILFFDIKKYQKK